MPTIRVTGTPNGNPSVHRTKPQLAVRRSFRKQVKKLLHHLQVMQARDNREATRAETLDYIPLLFKVKRGNDVETAMSKLVDRCVRLLNATVS